MNSIEYKQGIEHNYLIMSGRELKESYQTKMMIQNRISGFLALDIHYVDGAVKYYYRIDSKQPLVKLYEKTQMSYQQVTLILKQLQLLIQRSREYLLEEQFFCIGPEFLYIDETNNEIEIPFYPEKEQSEKEDFLKLAEFFLQHIDHKEEEAVLLAYQFYKITLQDNFVIQDIMYLLQGKDKIVEENKELPEYDSIETDKNEIEEETEKPKSIKNSLVLGTALLLIICGSIGMYMLPIWYEIGTAMIGLGGICLAYLTLCKIKQKRERKSKFPFHGEKEEISYEEGTILLNTHLNLEERILTGIMKGKEVVFPLKNLPVTIGKEAMENDIVIQNRAVSRKHASIDEMQGNLYLEDLDSTNGTYKNGIRLGKNEKVCLEPGDEVKIANITFIYT